MSLVEFKEFVASSGVEFDSLSNEEKRGWRETFDKSNRLVLKGIVPIRLTILT